MQSRDYWKLEKPTSLWNTIDFTYSGTAENTPISTSRHYKHFANTGFRYSTWRVHSMHNCTPQTDLWQHEAIIYLAAFYHAENFYKWVASLCSWKGPSPLWTSTEHQAGPNAPAHEQAGCWQDSPTGWRGWRAGCSTALSLYTPAPRSQEQREPCASQRLSPDPHCSWKLNHCCVQLRSLGVCLFSNNHPKQVMFSKHTQGLQLPGSNSRMLTQKLL